MLDRIKAFLEIGHAATAPSGRRLDDFQVAAAALLLEAERLDEHVDAEETATIRALLQARFALDDAATEALLAEAEREVEGSVELYGFARRIKDAFSHEERIDLMEMLWRVVYADGELHDLEANLMRRIAGLLFVSDKESGSARKRALCAPARTG